MNLIKLQLITKERGLSQNKIAKILGISQQSVNEWYTGKSIPSLERFIQLCYILQVSADYLLDLHF